MNDRQAARWAMLCHLSALLIIPMPYLWELLSLPDLPTEIKMPGASFGGVFGGVFLFDGSFVLWHLLNTLVTLIIWFTLKNQYSLIDTHGKESVNFQMSLTIYQIAAFMCWPGSSLACNNTDNILVCFILLFATRIIYLLVSLALMLIRLLLSIFAAIKAIKGNSYRYPLTIRFLR